jgi:small subunit ribosomal protein S9
MVTKKTPVKKTAAKKAPAKKVAAKSAKGGSQPKADQPLAGAKISGGKVAPKVAAEVSDKPVAAKTSGHAKPASGKYIFATGRRKTAVANVRLFTGNGANIVNKKDLAVYFSTKHLQEAVLRPLAISGLQGEYYFVAHVSGGGRISQAEAVRHGVAQALAGLSEDMHKVLKKNGFLTRDDRKKERKKPGLRRARRAPQWAKR